MTGCRCGGTVVIIRFTSGRRTPEYRGRCDRCMREYPARRWEYESQQAQTVVQAPVVPARVVEGEQLNLF